jgi:cysteinyl-tRNA synthetase
MNITDIDDKIIKKSQETDTPHNIITQTYETAFREDLNKLNIESAERMPHVTDKAVIDQIIKIIEDLLKKGAAYKSDDGSIYFSIKTFKNYGKLSGLNILGIKDGARVSQDEYNKEDAQDFALWKKTTPNEPFWDASFGKGRPGWHIECTAMSTKYLGDTIDIHAGGVDLIFPHHENEIALSETFTEKTFVKYWFHGEHLMVEGKKMSKSLGNLYTLIDVTDKYNVEALSFRMLCLMSSYRERLNFTKESIIQAQNTLNNIKDFILKNKQAESRKFNVEPYRTRFSEALDDDLNMPKALAAIFDLIKETNKNNLYGTNVYDFFLEIDKVLGLGLDKVNDQEIPIEVEDLLEARQKARINNDWVLADEIRENIETLGFEIEDTLDGPKAKKK